MSLPLDGVKVLDFTLLMAGPYCTLMLADMGADVTKVESFPEGDGARRLAPIVNGESYCFAVLNRNKKSIALDIKTPEGKDIFMRMAAEADILVENYRPGVMKKLGIGYEAIRKVNPGLIYASISGFGQTGPYGGRGGFDIIAQGMSGIMRMTGEPDGRPAKVGIAMNDIAAGVTMLYAILGSYIKKLKTGEGIFLDTSLLEAGFAWTFWEFGAYFGAGEIPKANGTRHRRNAPYQAFKTQDGYVTVGGNNDKLWKALCIQVFEKTELLSDPRFNPVEARLANVDALQNAIEAVLLTKPTAHWVARLDAAGVPGGPVYTYDQSVADPHILARGMVTELDHPKIGRMKNMGAPVKASADFTRTPEPAPWLGQQTDATLKGLGMSDEQIGALYAKGVVYDKYRAKAKD